MAAVRIRLFGFLFICLLFSFLSANSFHPLVVFVFVVISFNLFIIGKKTLLVGQVGELVRGCHLVVMTMVMMVLVVRMMVMMVLVVMMVVMMVLMMMTMGRSENWLVIVTWIVSGSPLFDGE